MRQGGLGGAVSGEAPAGQPSHGGTDVDDVAATGVFEHQGNRGHRQGVCGQHVEAEGVAHVLDAGGEQGVGHAAADIVDDDVEPAELLDGLSRQFRGGLRLGEVCDDDVRAAAGRLDLGGHRLQLRLGARGDQDVCTHFGERDGDRGSQSATGAGDYGNLSVETELVQDHVLSLVQATVTREL